MAQGGWSSYAPAMPPFPLEQPGEGLPFSDDQRSALVDAVHETQLEILAAIRNLARSDSRRAAFDVSTLTAAVRMLGLAGLPPVSPFDGGFAGGFAYAEDEMHDIEDPHSDD